MIRALVTFLRQLRLRHAIKRRQWLLVEEMVAAQMVERRQYDATFGLIRYRWDFGPYSVHDKHYPEHGTEAEWIETKRICAALGIVRMMKREAACSAR